MNKESLFLKIINENISCNSYLGDDCAYLKELNTLVSTDTLVEDVHFKTSYFTPYEIGKKAVLVNVSDILSGGGEPEYITVSLSGKLTEDFILNFYKGVNEICDKFKIKIIGGDLTAGDKISVSICILGSCFKKRPSSRKNAKPGDIVYIKGFHGSSAYGLKLLQRGVYDNNNQFVKAHKEPLLYPKEALYIASNVKTDYVMTDTSDGLYDALNKISIASNAGFDIDFDLIPKQIEDKNLVLFGGEDFGLLICLNPNEKKIAEFLNLQKTGIVTNSKKIMIDGLEVKEDKSFQHF